MGPEDARQQPFEEERITDKNGRRELFQSSIQTLNNYLDETKYIYALPKAVGNPNHPDIEDSERADYYMCRSANIVGAAQQIDLILRSSQIAETGKKQILQNCYRELRRIAARPGLRTEGEMNIVKKDIQKAVDAIAGKYVH